jgi:hypothetical protein
VREIWSPVLLGTLQRQLALLQEAALLSASDAKVLRQALDALLARLQQAASQEQFEAGGSYLLRFQDLHPLNNELLLHSEAGHRAYVLFGQWQFLPLNAPGRLAFLRQWLSTIWDQARPWSGPNVPERLGWFQRWQAA